MRGSSFTTLCSYNLTSPRAIEQMLGGMSPRHIFSYAGATYAGEMHGAIIRWRDVFRPMCLLTSRADASIIDLSTSAHVLEQTYWASTAFWESVRLLGRSAYQHHNQGCTASEEQIVLSVLLLCARAAQRSVLLYPDGVVRM